MATVSPQQAAKLVTKLKQPSDMHRPTWRRMQKLLQALCSHLPDPYPGIRALADKTGIPPRTVARLLTQAEGLGLLARVERPIPGHFDGYSYRLIFLDSPVPVSVPVSGQSGTEEEQELRSCARTAYSHRIKAVVLGGPAARPRKINRYTGRCDVCTETVRAGEGFLHGHLPVHRECDVRPQDPGDPAQWGDGYGDNPEAPLPSLSTRPPKPQARLAKYFEARWNDDALRLHPEWRGVSRGIDLGHGIGYIKRTFLDAGYSEEHVEVMIDAFYDDLLNPVCALETKEGQTAFQLFTGWWGHNAVPDPAIQRQKDAETERLRMAFAEQRLASGARREAAWARIEAVEAAGGTADPADLKEVGMPYVVPSRVTPGSRLT